MENVDREEVQEEVDNTEELALEAGFNDEELEPIEEQEEVEEPEVAEAEEEPEPELFAGMTEAELNVRLKKADQVDQLQQDFYKLRSTMSGTIGDMVAKRVEAIPKSALDSLSPQAREKMLEEYPEIEEILWGKSKAKETPAEVVKAAPEVETYTADDIAAAERKGEASGMVNSNIGALRNAHSDFATVYREPAFGEFVKTLPIEDQEMVSNGWDPVRLAGIFTHYKDTRNATKAASLAANEEKTQQLAEKKKRLQSAITPRGGGQVALNTNDEEAAMLEAFNA